MVPLKMLPRCMQETGCTLITKHYPLLQPLYPEGCGVSWHQHWLDILCLHPPEPHSPESSHGISIGTTPYYCLFLTLHHSTLPHHISMGSMTLFMGLLELQWVDIIWLDDQMSTMWSIDPIWQANICWTHILRSQSHSSPTYTHTHTSCSDGCTTKFNYLWCHL